MASTSVSSSTARTVALTSRAAGRFFCAPSPRPAPRARPGARRRRPGGGDLSGGPPPAGGIFFFFFFFFKKKKKKKNTGSGGRTAEGSAGRSSSHGAVRRHRPGSSLLRPGVFPPVPPPDGSAICRPFGSALGQGRSVGRVPPRALGGSGELGTEAAWRCSPGPARDAPDGLCRDGAGGFCYGRSTLEASPGGPPPPALGVVRLWPLGRTSADRAPAPARRFGGFPHPTPPPAAAAGRWRCGARGVPGARGCRVGRVAAGSSIRAQSSSSRSRGAVAPRISISPVCTISP